MNIVGSRLSNYCETDRLLPEEQCGFRPARPTIGMLFEVRRLHELGRQRKIPLYVCLVDLQRAYDSVDRELLWEVPTHSGVPNEMLTTYPQFPQSHAGRARKNGGERNRLMSRRGRGKAACYRRYYSTCSPPLRYTSYWYASAKAKPS